MKDALPDYVSGRLSAAVALEVAAHVEACRSCAAELAVVRAAHAAFPAPQVDIAKIVAALPAPPSKVIPLAPRLEKKRSLFTSWRVAATIATIAVSGVSIAVVQGILRDDNPPKTHRVVGTVKKAVEAPAEASGLSVGGNLNDLSEKEMQTLLDKLDELDAVPSAEPQPAVSGMRAAAGVQ